MYPMDETARGLRGFLARRWQTVAFVAMSVRFVLFYLTEARRVRRRYADAQRTGGMIWLDRGPFLDPTDERRA